ncbi:MAG TPA: hypothetical protein DCZ74_00955 [Treponema sp.]|nr:hypothetical protein [Treponema sp.]
MKRTCFGFVCALFALSTAPLAWAERAPKYISPNNDGVQDSLEIPLRVKDKSIIKEWTLSIYTEDGHLVRTVSNKRKDDSRRSISETLGSFFSPKTGVDVPSSVSWNGRLGDEAASIGLEPGSIAPDGVYYYIFSATDNYDNTGSSPKYYVVVDNTPPQVTFGALTDEEKIFGEGNKNSVRITQSGSEESEWTAGIIYNADGKKVKSFRWENSSPAPVVLWDGTNDDGTLVEDGIYTYEIYATDKAGNKSEKSQVTNIIFSAEKPVIAIAIHGNNCFSPNGDGNSDSITFDLTVPAPVNKFNSLSSWSVQVVGADNNTVYFKKDGGSTPDSAFVFNGRGADGNVLPEGEYKAVLSATYLNGYEPPSVQSPRFLLDLTAPGAEVSVSESIFNGSGNLIIRQKQTTKDSPLAKPSKWTGEIRRADGKIVRTWDFGTRLVDSVEWNGFDNDNHFVEDGTYSYTLRVVDAAGNKGSVTSAPFTLDTSKTELMLSVTPSAFSPNGNGVRDTVTFNPAAKASSGIDSYVLSVYNADGNVVRMFTGADSIPAAIVWDGKDSTGRLCKDGTYYVDCGIVAKSGTPAKSSRKSFVLDTVAPVVKAGVPYTIFSPDGLPAEISTRQTLPVTVSESSNEQLWTASISDQNGNEVKTFTWQADKPEGGKIEDFVWDGTDNNGNPAPNGGYKVEIFSEDEAGNKTNVLVSNVTLDNRDTRAYVTASERSISPNGDGFKDSQTFTVRANLTEGISDWTFKIVDSNGNSVREWNKAKDGALPSTIRWDGKTSGGDVAEGQFAGKLHISYEKGNLVDASVGFVSTATAPVLSVMSSANPAQGLYFSPDNDGNEDELLMTLFAVTKANVRSWSLEVKDSRNNEITFWKTGGTTMPADGRPDTYRASVTWDGVGTGGSMVMSAEDYPYVFSVTDDMGMTSRYTGIIPVDVLVIYDNGRLKMQVPSIVFRGDAADFVLSGERDANGNLVERSSLTEEQKVNNIRVLTRVAQILKKFDKYSVTVVGHANPMNPWNGDEADNPEENRDGSWGRGLKALSLERAQFVRQWLITEGRISASRLSSEGKGGLETIADKNDLENRWKNRRVEFILEK